MTGKSIMLSFKEFLLEDSVDKDLQYKTITMDEARSLLNKNCKNALWMKEKGPFYRGDASIAVSNNDIMRVNTGATTRRSASGVPNFYTEILDNHPEYKKFPKRSRSLICTNDKKTTNDYSNGLDEYTFCVIPFDNAKIGVVNDDDIWGVNVRFLGVKYSFNVINRALKDICDNLGIYSYSANSFNDLIHLDKLLKDGNVLAINEFLDTFDNAIDYIKDGKYTAFLEDLMDAFSIKNTQMQTCTTSNFHPLVNGTEVWIGGNVIIMNLVNWDKLMELGDSNEW